MLDWLIATPGVSLIYGDNVLIKFEFCRDWTSPPMTYVPLSEIAKQRLQPFWLFLIRSSSYLEVNNKGIRSWPGSNSSRIGLRVLELQALEH